MTLKDALTTARYVVDAEGRKTEIILPIDAWRQVLATYERLLDMLEDREDSEILQQWIAQRTAQPDTLISLDDLEQELIRDGLLPG